MKMTGIQKGFVNIDEKPCLDGDIDYQDVEKNMQAYRQASEKFLREALEG